MAEDTWLIEEVVGLSSGCDIGLATRHLIRQPAFLAQLGSTEKLAEENRRSATVAVAPIKLQLRSGNVLQLAHV